MGVAANARLVSALLVGLIAFVATRIAMLPGVGFFDTAEFQTVGPLMGTAHPTGFPTYVLLGWVWSVVLQPIAEPAMRMNLLSGVCLAVAAAVTVDLVWVLTGRLTLGIAAGLGIALTPIAWAMATHADAHSLHVALVAVMLRLLVAWEARARGTADLDAPDRGVDDQADRGDRYLVAVSVALGLSLGNHGLALLLAVSIALYVVAVDPRIWRRRRLLAWCAMALGGTVALVYLELPLRAGPFRAPLVYGAPDTLDGFRYIVVAEQFIGTWSGPLDELPRKGGELVSRTVAQFGILAPLIPIAFVATALRRPRYALLTGSAVVITCFFSASYLNFDISRYYVGPALMVWTWLAVLAGMTVDVLTRMRRRSAELWPPLGRLSIIGAGVPLRVHLDIVTLLVALVLVAPTIIEAPARYAKVDVSRQHDATQWVDHVFTVVEPGAVIVSYWWYSTPLWYGQLVEGRRPDVTVIDDRTRLDEGLGSITDVIDANHGSRPVYVIRQDIEDVRLLADRYVLDHIDGDDALTLTRVVRLRSTIPEAAGRTWCGDGAWSVHGLDPLVADGTSCGAPQGDSNP